MEQLNEMSDMSSLDKKITIRYDDDIEQIFEFATGVFPSLAGERNRSTLGREMWRDWYRGRNTRGGKTLLIMFHTWKTNHLQKLTARMIVQYMADGFMADEMNREFTHFDEIYTFDRWESEYLEGKGDYGLDDKQKIEDNK